MILYFAYFLVFVEKCRSGAFWGQSNKPTSVPLYGINVPASGHLDTSESESKVSSAAALSVSNQIIWRDTWILREIKGFCRNQGLSEANLE